MFDLVLSKDQQLLSPDYGDPAIDLQLVKWTTNGRSKWIDAADADRARTPVESGLVMR